MFGKFINRIFKKNEKIPDSIRPLTSWEIFKDYVRVHPTTIIDPIATIKIFNPPVPPKICLEIGEGSHIFSSFAVLRPDAKIVVGKRCQLGASQFICAKSINVGDDVIMAWSSTVIDSDNHSLYWDERQFDVERCRQDYVQTGGYDIARNHDWSKVNLEEVNIGNKAWIGFNVIILKGVTIGEGAIIGTGSVVVNDVNPWHVGAGNPFRHIRKITKERGK